MDLLLLFLLLFFLLLRHGLSQTVVVKLFRWFAFVPFSLHHKRWS
jgi:hypothetical protein